MESTNIELDQHQQSEVHRRAVIQTYLTNAGANALETHMANMTRPFDWPRAYGDGAFSLTSSMLTLKRGHQEVSILYAPCKERRRASMPGKPLGKSRVG